VHLGARVVPLEQQPVLRQRIREIADTLVVDREAEMIGFDGSRRRDRR
jgi:hypothetical protein